MEEYIKLVANDGTNHTVSFQAAKRSEFITKYLEHTDPNATEILIAEANGPTLCLVIEYLEYYKDSEPRIIIKPMEDDQRLQDLVDKWDLDFAERSQDLQDLQDLIVAADYMLIDSLHELMIAKMACMMIDLGSSEAIVRHFNIEEDMTEEEQLENDRQELEELKNQRKKYLEDRKAIRESNDD